MGMNRSLDKGKRFEREACSILKEFTKAKWNRVPNSGGLSEQSTMHQFQGDCYCEAAGWDDIVVECKSWNDISLNEWYSDKSKLWNAIRQARNESKGNRWVLMIKLNNKGVFALSDEPKLLSDIGFGFRNELRLNAYYTILKVR